MFRYNRGTRRRNQRSRKSGEKEQSTEKSVEIRNGVEQPIRPHPYWTGVAPVTPVPPTVTNDTLVTAIKDDVVNDVVISSEIQTTDKCPCGNVEVLMNPLVKQAIDDGLRLYNTEWAFYLIGDQLPLGRHDNTLRFEVVDIYVPKQEVAAASVEITEDWKDMPMRFGGITYPTEVYTPDRIIGHLHSHVSMGVFFSGTDDDHENWPLMIVVSKTKGETRMEAKAIVKTPCGRLMKSSAKIIVDGNVVDLNIPWADKITQKVHPGYSGIDEYHNFMGMGIGHRDDSNPISNPIVVNQQPSMPSDDNMYMDLTPVELMKARKHALEHDRGAFITAEDVLAVRQGIDYPTAEYLLGAAEETTGMIRSYYGQPGVFVWDGDDNDK